MIGCALLTGSQHVKVSGIAEMLVQHQLAMISELHDKYDMDVVVELVRSEVNKLDALTNLPDMASSGASTHIFGNIA